MASRKHLLRGIVAAACLFVVELCALKALPYSSSQVEWWNVKGAGDRPSEATQVGELSWDYAAYKSAPSLEPLRQYFHVHCGTKLGAAAALCLSDEFAQRFAHGAPAHEFVNTNYDPVADFDEHVAGAAGHCVTRSSMIADALLAVGIPARVIQLLGPSFGHNTVEVWDEQRGWTIVDPTYGGIVCIGNGGCSAAAMLASPQTPLALRQDGLAPRGIDAVPYGAHTDGSRRVLGFAYPEPWLYTRVGKRFARPPFRGAFAYVGEIQANMGPLQSALHLALIVTALAGACAGVLLLKRNRAPTLAESKRAPMRPILNGVAEPQTASAHASPHSDLES